MGGMLLQVAYFFQLVSEIALTKSRLVLVLLDFMGHAREIIAIIWSVKVANTRIRRILCHF